jgi:small subunit ribosomal protein S18
MTVRGKALPKASIPNIRFFSSSTNNNDNDNDNNNKKSKTSSAPTEYYHEETENERQLLEVISTLQNKKDLRGLSETKSVMTWEDIHAAREAPLETMPDPLSMDSPMDTAVKDFSDFKAINEIDDDTEDQLVKDMGWRDIDDFMLKEIVNPEVGNGLNFNLPTGSKVIENSFPRQISPENLNFTKAGLAKNSREFQQNEDFPDFPKKRGPCPGKLQRGGAKGILRCTKIDLDALHYMDVMTLREYLTEDAEIMHRKRTGLCAKCQRSVARTIKHARSMGLLPHIGNYDILEFARDDNDRAETHASVRVDQTYFQARVQKK